MTYSWLHSVSYALLWAGLLSVFLAASMLYARLRKDRIKPSPESKGTYTSAPILTVTERTLLFTVVLSMIAIVQNVFLINTRFFERYQVYEYTADRDGCCEVLGVADGGRRWHLLKNDGDFWLDFCPDYDVASIGAAPGYIIRKLRYQDMGCKSIARKDLGVWWVFDRNGNPVQEKEQ
jgi:hypothetical protein